MKTKIIRFIGFSGSGKTTLIEKIIKQLSDEGMNIATVKHDVHGLEIDKPGKDSYRYSVAGARVSVVSSPDLVVLKIHKKLDLDDIILNIKDVDLIIIEGSSAEITYPTISVARKDTRKGIKGELKDLIAVVSDYNDNELKEMGYEGQSFDINNIKEIIEYIKKL